MRVKMLHCKLQRVTMLIFVNYPTWMRIFINIWLSTKLMWLEFGCQGPAVRQNTKECCILPLDDCSLVNCQQCTKLTFFWLRIAIIVNVCSGAVDTTRKKGVLLCDSHYRQVCVKVNRTITRKICHREKRLWRTIIVEWNLIIYSFLQLFRWLWFIYAINVTSDRQGERTVCIEHCAYSISVVIEFC